MKDILKTYYKRLTNLTSRNRSLLLLRLPQRQFFDLNAADFLLNQPAFQLVKQLMERQRVVPVCDFLDPRDERTNERSKQLRQLAKTEQLISEERGAEDLYVGYPMVQGKFADGTLVRCPLLFFPVTLKVNPIQKKPRWCIEQREADIVFNRSFLLAYAHFNQVKIGDEWLEFSLEDFPKDALAFRTMLYETLKNSPLEINFNQTLFEDKLLDFQEIKRSELEETERNGELKLYPQAVLGIFPQAGSYIAADYETLLSNDEKTPADMADFFGGETADRQRLIREEEMLLPLAADASQETAIKSIKSGRSMVVQGPPGTGKSQLIANLIADFTARGQRVLVVCQKRAALDTVHRRLTETGLSPFMALVHDFKNDRKALFGQIARQIEQVEPYERQNNGLDAIFMERNYDQVCREIDRTTRDLDALKNALFDESIAGIPVKEMYLQLADDATVPEGNFAELYHFFRMNEVAETLDKIGRLNRYYVTLATQSAAADFWAKRRSAANWQLANRPEITAAISDSFTALKQLERVIHTVANKSVSYFSLPLNFSENAKETLQHLANDADFYYFKMYGLNTRNHAKKADSKQIIRWKEQLQPLIEGGIEPYFLGNPENDFYLRLFTEVAEKSDSFFSKTLWQFFGKEKNEWKKLAAKFGIAFTPEANRRMAELIRRTQDFYALQRELERHGIETANDPVMQNQTLKNVQKGLVALETASAPLKQLLLSSETTYEMFRQKATQLAEATEQTRSVIEKSSQWLEPHQVEQLASLTDVSPVLDYFRQYFDFLIEHDQLLETFSATEKRLLAAIPPTETDPTRFAYVNLLRQWVSHIENQYPILRGVSTLKVNQLEETLQNAIGQKQALCTAIVQQKLRESTYKNLERNRLGNVTTYRELYHQVTKKRQLWSVRKVAEKFSGELFDLIPCWLASPETVSALFPLDGKPFDLVIFDEASQCYAEHGLPSAMRGRQVVIAGDSKQLPPNDLYQIRYEEAIEEDQPLLEIDSLLDVATHYLPQTLLQGHYRSKSPALIDFSNQHFYQNKLSLLPDYQSVIANEFPIHFEKVAGIWENNRNLIEAEKVIDIIRKTAAEKTIGVVTFNFKQAELIDNLLRADGEKHERVRVKNIENIQGDEFDVVIFSVGYAPNQSGKLLMNFGSLNQQGGENRLNVAVTRAREKVWVVASIFPHELNVADSRHEGPRKLQAYLQFARDVSEGNFTSQPYQSARLTLALSLKNRLTQQYAATGTLPFADVTVMAEGRPAKLILTDDDLYFDSLSSKHTHAYLPLMLRQKGWIFERHWSRNAPPQRQ